MITKLGSKPRDWWVALLLVVAGFSFASAQTRPLQFLVSGGVAYPVAGKSFSDGWNTGINLGLGVAVPVTDRIATVVSVEASNMPLDDERYLRANQLRADENFAEEGSATVIAGHVAAKITFSRSRTGEAPYALLGATVAMFSRGDVLISAQEGSETNSYVVQGESKAAFGLGGGLGFDVSLSHKSFLFFEARYTVLFTSDPSVHFVPLRLGIAFR